MTDRPGDQGVDRARLLLNAAVDGELGDAERAEWDALRAADPSLAEAESELRALRGELRMLGTYEADETGGGAEVEDFVAEVTRRVESADRLGERAVAAGFLTPKALRALLAKQEKYRKRGGKVPRIGQLMLHAGHVDKKQVKRLLREQREAQASVAVAVEEAVAEPPPKRKRVREIPRFDPGTEYAEEFVMEERLGDDSLGDVYLARQSAKERPSLVVIVDPAHTADKGFKKRLVDRMKSMVRMDHPNVQSLYKFGKSRGSYYAALEYPRGDLAEDKLKARKPMDYTLVMKVWAQLIDGLRALHASGLVHGDLHPRNVTLNKDEALITRCGTPLMRDYFFGDWERMSGVYTAPEVLEGGEPDLAADVFGVGTIVYHMFCGTPAWRANSVEDAIERVGKGAPSVRKHNGRVPTEVADLVDTLIDPDPAKRPTDLARLKRAVSKLPQDIQTRVAVNYASVLGKAALDQPSSQRTKAPSASQTGSQRRTGGAESGRTPQSTRRSTKRSSGQSTKTMNYSQLVAQMNKDAVTEARKEAAAGGASQRTSLADLASSGGRAYRAIDAQEKRGLPRQVVQSLAATLMVFALGGLGFYSWSVNVQERKNAETRAIHEARKPKDEKIVQKDSEVVARQNRAQVRLERTIKLYEELVRDFDQLEVFDRGKLENLIARTGGVISQGRKGWPQLGDAYNLLGRLEFYWAYTDRHRRIQSSVKKDHVSLSMAAFRRAKAFYGKKDAESSLRLKVHKWMPEHREPKKFNKSARRRGGRAPKLIRTRDRKDALEDLEIFVAGAKANPY